MMPSLLLRFTSLVGLSLLFYIYTKIWLNSKKIIEKLRYQGINGPKPSLFFGNVLDMKRIQHEAKTQFKEGCSATRFISDYTQTISPYLISWRKKYGQLFLYSMGTIPILHVTDPDLVKAVFQCTPLELSRPKFVKNHRKPLFGENSIFTANAELWAHERKIIAQELSMHRVKGMVNAITECGTTLTETWHKILEKEGGKAEISVQSYLRSFSGSIISSVCFGNSYGEGEEVLSKVSMLEKVWSKSNLFTAIPGARYLPTKRNREILRLNREIRSLIQNIVEEHKQQSLNSTNRDLLHSIIEGSTSIPDRSIAVEEFIIDNCKTLYFGGLETTAVTATWCLFLLAVYPEWQDCVRKEVLEVTHGATPDFDMLRQFKMLTMVIHETLRLFSPAFAIMREALHDMKLQEMHIPKGTAIQITIAMLHRDHDMWGPDADNFNPTRFANGISGACKYPHMFVPFGFGPRNCVGQYFSVVELKILLALLLSRFSFDLSPSYVHSPVRIVVVEPEHDLPLIVKKLSEG